MSGIFDGLYVDQLFQKNERGETIYYPFGLMGRGYLLPAEREAGVKAATRRLMLFSLVIGISFALLLSRIVDSEGLLIGGAAFAALLGGIIYFQSRLANGLEPAPGPRPSVGEWLRRGRQARARWTYWACLGLGGFLLLLAAGGLAISVGVGDLAGLAAGVVLLLLGGLLTWDGMMGLRGK